MINSIQKVAQLSLLALLFLAPVPSLAQVNVNALYGRCTSAKDSGSCNELALIYSKSKRPADRKLAARYFRFGCSIQKNRKCSKAEVTSMAKAFSGSRALASERPGRPAPKKAR